MVTYYEPLEIADDDGNPTGKYRMTRRTDEPESGPFGLCQHEHVSKSDARACPEARANLPAEMRRHRVKSHERVITDECRTNRSLKDVVDDALLTVKHAVLEQSLFWPVGKDAKIHITVEVEYEQ